MKYKALEIITGSAKETQKVGRILAEEIVCQPNKKDQKALVIGLEGDLGSGKTTFIQGLAKGFGIKERITSPTFVIFKKYKIQVSSFYHIDCYRIAKAKELIDLDFREILSSPQNVIAIEWAERISKILPSNALWMKFEYLPRTKQKRESGLVRGLDKDRRKIIL